MFQALVKNYDYFLQNKISWQFIKNIFLIPLLIYYINTQFYQSYMDFKFLKSYLGYNKGEVEYEK